MESTTAAAAGGVSNKKKGTKAALNRKKSKHHRPDHTPFEKQLVVFINGNAVLQLLVDFVLEILHLVPTRINHLSLTFLNAFMAYKTLSAVQKGKFQFLHEDAQVLWLMEVCLIAGDVFYMIYYKFDYLFFYVRLPFIILSLINWLVVSGFIYKYKLWHITYQGHKEREKEKRTSITAMVSRWREHSFSDSSPGSGFGASRGGATAGGGMGQRRSLMPRFNSVTEFPVANHTRRSSMNNAVPRFNSVSEFSGTLAGAAADGGAGAGSRRPIFILPRFNSASNVSTTNSNLHSDSHASAAGGAGATRIAAAAGTAERAYSPVPPLSRGSSHKLSGTKEVEVEEIDEEQGVGVGDSTADYISALQRDEEERGGDGHNVGEQQQQQEEEEEVEEGEERGRYAGGGADYSDEKSHPIFGENFGAQSDSDSGDDDEEEEDGEEDGEEKRDDAVVDLAITDSNPMLATTAARKRGKSTGDNSPTTTTAAGSAAAGQKRSMFPRFSSASQVTFSSSSSSSTNVPAKEDSSPSKRSMFSFPRFNSASDVSSTHNATNSNAVVAGSAASDDNKKNKKEAEEPCYSPVLMPSSIAASEKLVRISEVDDDEEQGGQGVGGKEEGVEMKGFAGRARDGIGEHSAAAHHSDTDEEEEEEEEGEERK